MSDPMEKLRADARRGTNGDGFDAAGVLDRIHQGTAAHAPGGLTHRRRAARAGALSVAGVGAVAAAGLVVGGVVSPGAHDGADLADGPTAHVVSHELTGQTVAYVKKARAAVADVDLANTVLAVTATEHSKQAGSPAWSTKERYAYAGDGSASHWWSITDTVGGPSTAGTEEVKQSVPGASDGRMTYTWISRPDGVYTQFPWSVKTSADDDSETVQDQIKDQLAKLVARLNGIEKAAALSGVKSSGPVSATVDGHDATCITLSGDGATADAWIDQIKPSGGSLANSDVISWTSKSCFDPATNLPLGDSYSERSHGEEPKTVDTTEVGSAYQWLPRNDDSLALLAPDVDGLRKVSYDTYGSLTK